MNKKSNKENKELTKQDERQIKIKKVRNIFKEGTSLSVVDPEIEELIELWNKKGLSAKEKERKDNLQLEISKAFGLKNGLWAANLSHERYHKFLATTRSVIVKEYDCKAPIELILADRIVANYWRSMRLDMTLNRLIEKEDGGYTFNDSKMNVIRELGKGLESASRQLNTSILLLKELKQPKLNVRVNTKSAFIGENQQFNVNKQDNQQQDEINEPK